MRADSGWPEGSTAGWHEGAQGEGGASPRTLDYRDEWELLDFQMCSPGHRLLSWLSPSAKPGHFCCVHPSPHPDVLKAGSPVPAPTSQ